MFILVVVCFVFIIFPAESTDLATDSNPEIRLSFERSNSKDYIVWRDKPLTIVLEGAANYYDIRIWCGNSYDTYKHLNGTSKVSDLFVPEAKFPHGIINIINVTRVIAEMSTMWVCRVGWKEDDPVRNTSEKLIYEYFLKFIYFNLHVKGLRTVSLIANDKSLTYETTNLSVYYDGEANYTYGDNEDFPIYFSCEKPDSEQNQDTLRLEYYNAEGIILFETKPHDSGPIFFHSVFKSNNHRFYLDCIRADVKQRGEYRYRTTFYRRDLHAETLQHALILIVNGQKLTSFYNTDELYDNYRFRYIDGEVLTFECRKKDVNTKGSLILYLKGIKDKSNKSILRFAPLSAAVISLNISTLDIDSDLFSFLTCGIHNANARLLFLSDVPGNDVRIRGLPRSNILYQYTNGQGQWTIEYQYSVNNTVNLTCVWHERNNISSPFKKPFWWKFEDETLYSEAIDMPRIDRHKLIRFSEISLIKTLNASHNGTKIQCMYLDDFNSSKATVEIILRLKPTLLSEENQIVSEQNIIISGIKSINSYTLVYCLTAAGVSVIILLTISYWCYKRSSSEELPPVETPRPHPDTVFYENLLSVFRPINEREAAELENVYEEIE